MAKIVDAPKVETIKVQTRKASPSKDPKRFSWWNAGSKKDLSDQLISTAAFLKQNQLYRFTQAGIFARLYGNMPMFNVIGTNLSRTMGGTALPIDRPTMNVVQSCIDTLVSRITQSKPRPVFLTDNGDHKQRSLAKQLNQFIQGEFHQTNTYALGEFVLRDAAVIGSGCLKVYEDPNTKRVALDRVLAPELLVDANDGLYGTPRSLIQLKIIDRSVLQAAFPNSDASISRAEQAYPDSGGEAGQTVSDQVMVAEGWHLPSGKDSGDGLHTIACSSGIVFSEEFTKERFPFAFMHYSPRLLGFWGQSLAEQLMGTQIEINKLLITISKSINLMGVPRILREVGSKISKAHFNNEIGTIIDYSGTLPTFMEGNSGIAADIYAQLQRLVEYAYQQSGVSGLAASAQKPAGLNSGEAIRNYDDLQSDRFAALARRYDNLFIDLAYLMVDQAKDICERDGSYQTIYPDKDGTREIDLPGAKLLDDPFVIQCYDSSSLPRDPAGRKQYVTEMMQAGILSPQEGRRLLQFPDLEQEDKLANAAEERILSVLDDIVEHGKYLAPDPFMDLQLAQKLAIQYYNLYLPAKLEESRAQLLRDFITQVQAMTAPPPMPMAGAPIGVPEANPQSDLMPMNGSVPSPESPLQ